MHPRVSTRVLNDVEEAKAHLEGVCVEIYMYVCIYIYIYLHRKIIRIQPYPQKSNDLLVLTPYLNFPKPLPIQKSHPPESKVQEIQVSHSPW